MKAPERICTDCGRSWSGEEGRCPACDSTKLADLETYVAAEGDGRVADMLVDAAKSYRVKQSVSDIEATNNIIAWLNQCKISEAQTMAAQMIDRLICRKAAGSGFQLVPTLRLADDIRHGHSRPTYQIRKAVGAFLAGHLESAFDMNPAVSACVYSWTRKVVSEIVESAMWKVLSDIDSIR